MKSSLQSEQPPESMCWPISIVILAVLLILPSQNSTASDTSPSEDQSLRIGQFSDGTVEGWERESFAGETIYTLVTDSTLQQTLNVLKASSDNTASGVFRKLRIDLEKTPWIHWSWKTEQLFSGINEKEKSGDDFVARLYIVIDGGILFWNSHALNYVWSSSHLRDETWPNPYTSNVTMFAVESGNSAVGKWQSYKRNVREDLRILSGKDVRYIDAIGIMTDSDDSGQKATTYYGDIFFTPHQRINRGRLD